MKKAVVLVLTVLALAGFASMAFAAQNVFVNGWVHPMSMWMGANQDTYGTNPGGHAINTQSTPYADPAVADPEDAANLVAQILYSKNLEAWAGRSVQVNGSATATLNLSGSASLNFKIRRGSTMSADVTVSKVAMFDSNGNEVSDPSTNNIIAIDGWKSLSIPLTGKNLSGVNKLFEIIMTDTQDAANGNIIEVLLDDVRYTDSSSGAVTVTLTTGIVGVTVTGSINFGTTSTNAALNSADILDPAQNHFLVTNIGNTNAVYSLNLVNPSLWSASVPTLNLADASLRLTTNRFGLYGIFTDDSATPVLASYKGTAAGTSASGDSDVINITPFEATQGTASAAVYGGVTAANGYNVAPSVTRNLWIGLKMPNQIDTAGSGTATILVVVSAASL